MNHSKITTRIAIGLFAWACLVGCRSEPTTRAGGPPKMDAPSAGDGAFEGRVAERLKAGSYCYMQVQTAAGAKHWVVTLGSGHPVGAEVSVKTMGVRNAFQSKRLDRTFDKLLFAIVNSTT